MACKYLFGKPEWKREIEEHCRRRNDNIKINLKHEGREALKLIWLVDEKHQEWALVNKVLHLRLPTQAQLFLNRRTCVSFWTKFQTPRSQGLSCWLSVFVSCNRRFWVCWLACCINCPLLRAIPSSYSVLSCFRPPTLSHVTALWPSKHGVVMKHKVSFVLSPW